MAQTYAIKEIASLTGIKAHTIRVWELRYGILVPKRTATNFRYYDNDDVQLLLNISYLNKSGYKISTIAKHSPEQIQELVAEVGKKEVGENFGIEELTKAMIALNERAFDAYLDKVILENGLESTMLKLVFPFMRQVGYMWQAGAITASHEHFTSNLVRKKIILATHSQPIFEGGKRYVLYLPELEYHELGLLFANYILKAQGNHTIYLGQNVPFDDLIVMCKGFLPDCIITAITAPLPNQDTEEYVYKLAQNFDNARIYLSGYCALSLDIALPKNVEKIHDFSQLKKLACSA